MHKLLSASVTLAALAVGGRALAADLIPKAPPPVVIPWSWTGFYVGGNVGFSAGRSRTDNTFFNDVTGKPLLTASHDFNMNGAIGGGQIGYNWQYGPWVWGLEADIQASGQDGRHTFVCDVDICNRHGDVVDVDVRRRLDWFGTVRGRFGTTVWTPAVLAYVTGGLAFGQIKTDVTVDGPTGPSFPTNNTFNFDRTRAGWTVGAGVEARLGGNWTGKLEYLFMDLGKVSFTEVSPITAPPLRAQFNSRFTDNIVRVGLNYKFEPGIIAGY
jgi:outer membrane immunogenic protein